MIKDINFIIEKINTREDFEQFLGLLMNESELTKWENNSAKDYLEAIKTYSSEMVGYYNNVKKAEMPSKPTWKTFAEILYGATMYE